MTITDNDIEYLLNSYEAKKNWTNSTNRRDRLGNRIEFKLTIEEWFDLWLADGRWRSRLEQTKDSVCISRQDDIGSYEVGNVFLQTKSANTKEARANDGPRSAKQESAWEAVQQANAGRESFRKGKTHSELYGEERAEELKSASVNMLAAANARATCSKCRMVSSRSLITRYHDSNCKRSA